MIPQWLWNKRIGVYDLETDYIPTTQIFCNSVSIIDIDAFGNYTVTPSRVFTKHWTSYTTGSLMEAIALLWTCDYICAHNLVAFDALEILKHQGITLPGKPLDTLILSKIIFSKDDFYGMDPQLGIDADLIGSYSLKTFGQRFGDFKIDYNDFSHLSEEMTIYCNKDTDLAVKLLLFLLEKENFPIEAVVDIEHRAAKIIAEQTEFGFYLDIEKANALNTALLKEKGELSRELLDIFKPKFLKDGKVKVYAKPSTVRKYYPNANYIPLLGTP